MESDTFINATIYNRFRNEFFKYFGSTYRVWEDFIKSKDLGVICLSHFNDEYIIIDEKKWLLAKIKYGL